MRPDLAALLLRTMPATVEDLAAECGYSLSVTRQLLRVLRDTRQCFMLRRQEDGKMLFIRGRGLDSRPKPAGRCAINAKAYQKRKAKKAAQVAAGKGPFAALFI